MHLEHILNIHRLVGWLDRIGMDAKKKRKRGEIIHGLTRVSFHGRYQCVCVGHVVDITLNKLVHYREDV